MAGTSRAIVANRLRLFLAQPRATFTERTGASENTDTPDCTCDSKKREQLASTFDYDSIQQDRNQLCIEGSLIPVEKRRTREVFRDFPNVPQFVRPRAECGR